MSSDRELLIDARDLLVRAGYGKSLVVKRIDAQVAIDILPPMGSNVTMRFWACRHCMGQSVRWEKDVAICCACGSTSED